MKIAVISDVFPPLNNGGAARMAWEIARQYVKNGHEVHVITCDGGPLPEEGYTIHVVRDTEYNPRWRNFYGLSNPRAVAKVKNLLAKIYPSEAHIHNVHARLSWETVRTCRDLGMWVVVTLHDCMALVNGKYMPGEDVSWFGQLKRERFRFNPIRNFMISQYLFFANHVVAVSNKQAELLRNNGVRVDKVIHNGIDVSRWKRVSEPMGYYLYLGGKKREKGIELAKKKAADDGRELLIADTADHHSLLSMYSRSSLVLIPSLCLDCSPVVSLEAQAVGVPIWKTENVGDYADGDDISIERCARQYEELFVRAL